MLKSALAFLCLFSFAAVSASAQPVDLNRPFEPKPGVLKPLVPGHYAYNSENSDFISGVIVTSEGVVVVDALGTEALAKDVRQKIAGVTGQPVRFLISSPYHDPFTGGNGVYQDVVKIAHQDHRADLITQMKVMNVPAAVQPTRLPQLTYRDRMTLYLGGKEIQIIHPGRAHTRGDTIVFVPQDRIVYMSEVFFYDRFPWINTGYIEWIKSIDVALSLDADIFVPGHGKMADDPRQSRQALVQFRQILVDARDAVQKEIARGATEDQVVATVSLSQYKDKPDYEQKETLLRRIYQDLKGTLK